MDPVEKFFRDLPSPEADRAALDQKGDWDRDPFKQLLSASCPFGSRDPDLKIVVGLYGAFFTSLDFVTVRTALGRLALDKALIPNDGSVKSQQLKYHAWISRGRKDEEDPFNLKPSCKGQRADSVKHNHAYLPANLTEPKTCANCEKPAAMAACSGCLFKVDSHVVIKTAYCSKTCQAQHWEQHKPYCLERRRICRAVPLLYDLFVTFQKNANVEKNISAISEKHGITNVDYGDQIEPGLRGTPLFGRFPPLEAPSEEHTIAALFVREIPSFSTSFRCLVNLLLLPLCKSLEEVHVTPRNAYRPTCGGTPEKFANNMYTPHLVLRATLKSGEQMAVDIGGAYFGWRETVAPWSIWASHRVVGKACPQRWGIYGFQSEVSSTFFSPPHELLGLKQRQIVAEGMEAAVTKTMKENKAPGVGALYKLDDAGFAACKLAVLAAAEEAVVRGVREFHESKLGRGYVDELKQPMATITRQQTEALQQVWLTARDVKLAKQRGTDPFSIYKLRCKGQRRRRAFEAAGLSMP
ncbi:hypothetical protein F5Y08DRAFT_331157 [Xylaria arbuscula]|nr:hypothetical protein F5Y08DRAFT_331157 [Xylaria arbuscula]